MIPTNQVITVTKSTELDEWGVPVESEKVTYRTNLRNRTEKTTDSQGNEIVTSTTLLIKGYAPIKYEDLIEWETKDGEKYSGSPKLISHRKDFSNTTLFTKVQL